MHRPLRPAPCACAVALILAHFLVIALAWSPDFHEWLHGDAGHSHHECAASVYASGQIDQPVVSAVSVAPVDRPSESVVLPPDSPRELVAAAGGSQERAPPAA